jgi:putative DNA-invertase from lambdoid prophage Rac
LKVAIYARVSTEDQTTENQTADIVRWLSAHNISNEDVVWYRENESAWKLNHQAELSRLLRDLRTGRRKFDVLLVWALDRLSRQGIVPLISMLNSLRSYGCLISSCKEPWLSPENNMQEAFVAFIAWAAKFESDRKSERVKASHERARSKGVHIGRPKGKKDSTSHPRRKSGYYERWAGKKLPAENGG